MQKKKLIATEANFTLQLHFVVVFGATRYNPHEMSNVGRL